VKPRVLLIGDSISMGYTEPTRKLLEGQAEVERIPENGGPTIRGLENMAVWLADGAWDIIHFNFGLHDIVVMEDGKHQVPIQAYEQNLRELVKQMQATGARLIWASTTPVPPGEVSPFRGDEDAIAYNAVAKQIMDDNGIPINDLYAKTLPRLAELQQPVDVHFAEHGYEVLAEWVAASIAAELGNLASD